jgi:hypothetical protein
MSEEQQCDDCGRPIRKAHRIEKLRRYCGICYARAFVRRVCPRCGNFARLPRENAAAICRKCEKAKPCVRCGRTHYLIGKVTPYGPACKACALYFREPKPCGICGSLSSQLSRKTRAEIHIPVCPRCARRDHGTCDSCRRHRSLQATKDGRFRCKRCIQGAEIACSVCHKTIPPGRGKRCEACYWRETFKKRVEINLAAFSKSGMAESWLRFGEWLLAEIGEVKASRFIHRYLPFFLELELRWGTIPSYDTLLTQFGARTLRQVTLPMRWMEVTGVINPCVQAKMEDSENRRIMSALERFSSGSQEQNLLMGYYKSILEAPKKRTTLRSIRLALTPAVALLLGTKETTSRSPNQDTIDAYLKRVPGQRAAISGFIRYLRDTRGFEITLPKKNAERAQQNRRAKLEAQMLTMIKSVDRGQTFRRRWVSVTLAYFHGLPRKISNKVREQDVTETAGGVLVTLDNHQYWLPLPAQMPASPDTFSDEEIDKFLPRSLRTAGRQLRGGEKPTE